MTDQDTESTSTKAVLSLVCGILAWTGLCPCLGAFLAILLGAGEKSGVARAGVILGWVYLGLLLVALVVAALFLGFAAVVGAVD